MDRGNTGFKLKPPEKRGFLGGRVQKKSEGVRLLAANTASLVEHGLWGSGIIRSIGSYTYHTGVISLPDIFLLLILILIVVDSGGPQLQVLLLLLRQLSLSCYRRDCLPEVVCLSRSINKALSLLQAPSDTLVAGGQKKGGRT